MDPVKAGRPTSAKAVVLRVAAVPKTTDWSYMDPLEEKREVEIIGNASDYGARESRCSGSKRARNTYVPGVSIIDQHDDQVAKCVANP